MCRELAVDDVEVGAAHAARADAYRHLARAGLRHGDFPDREPPHRPVEDGGAHRRGNGAARRVRIHFPVVPAETDERPYADRQPPRFVLP